MMEPDQPQSTPKPSSLRWQILRCAFLRRPSNSDDFSKKISLNKVLRRMRSGFKLKEHGPSEAILICPRRGDSLDKFLLEVEASGLHFTINETYDAEI